MSLKRLLAVVLSLAILLSPVAVTQAEYTAPPYEYKELICLAKNIYFESRGEPKRGQLAVAYVTMNRVNDHRFHNSVCEVVHAKKKVKGKYVCQFSWVCEGKKKITDWAAFGKAKILAHKVITRYNDNHDPTNGALFFHTKQVRPSWSRAFKKVVTIGDHIFYKPTRSDLNG